jgi:hypothetical protein
MLRLLAASFSPDRWQVIVMLCMLHPLPHSVDLGGDIYLQPAYVHRICRCTHVYTFWQG